MAQSTRRSGRRHSRAANAVWGILFMALAAGLFCNTAFAFTPDPEAQATLLLADAADDTSAPYLMPTDTEYITDADLAGFTAEELSLIRNEIYARHGYDFQNESIRAYFETKDWYEPIPGLNASTFDASVFNKYETANIAVILAYEKAGRAAETGASEAAADQAQEDLNKQADAGQEQSWLKKHKYKLLIGAAMLAGLVLLDCFGSDKKSSSSKKRSSSRSTGYRSYSSGGYSSSEYSSGGYSSSGYGSSFGSSTHERTFTEGGPTGCGIGGSFCGCGSGR